jgi:hypothetical protein
MTLQLGGQVRIERDETRYPSKGTWPQFRGRRGTIVLINGDEYGVVFGKVWPRADRPGVLRWSGEDVITWFKAYELARIGGAGAGRGAGAVHCKHEGRGTGDSLAHAVSKGAA